MKRIIALLLSISLLLTGCDFSQTQKQASPQNAKTVEVGSVEADELITWEDDIPEYSTLDDDGLLGHVEDLVYRETVRTLDSEEYFVENVNAVYISKEYLEELAYNSQANIYFGYTLDELDDLFQGTRYIFTLDENGQTTVQELQEIEDTSAESILKNIVIGTGIILVCVTVSAVSGGLGAPAVSMIFAASAKTGSIMALSSGGIGAVSAGIVRGIETGDFDEAMEAASLVGSEGFKWGAISGAISGGTGEAIALKGAACNGLTMNEAAIIQRESEFPLDVIKQFSNLEQYNICKKAGLSPQMVNGQTALVRNINLNYMDDMGRTNLERMRQGLAALDDSGTAYELHHIGQKTDSTLAILTMSEHRQGGNNTIWHQFGNATEVHGAGNNWDAQRQSFWQAIARSMEGV